MSPLSEDNVEEALTKPGAREQHDFAGLDPLTEEILTDTYGEDEQL